MAEGRMKPKEGGCPNLGKVFEILSQAPQERLFSLTYKMGRKPTEELVHAMCLIFLKKHGAAHAKLTAYSDSSVGNYLAEMIKTHGERLNCSHIGGFMPTDANSLLDIARIFAILVQERLCDESPRDQAYCTALESCRTAGLLSLDVEEEVKQVCGPDVISKSNSELSTETCNLNSLKVSDIKTYPLPPKPESGVSSYYLEISSPTASEGNIEESKPMSLHTPTEFKCQDNLKSCHDKSTNIYTNSQPQTAEVNDATSSNRCLHDNSPSQFVTSKNTHFSSSPNDGAKPKAQPINANDCKPPSQADSFQPTVSSDVDETFYAFVILHEAEDADEAQRLRDKLEGIISANGATFSDDFAQAGRSTLRCIEDAIENSAFALLLLTQNFKSNQSMTTTDSAIVNSLENHHKLNSVIPLLPRKNRLSRSNLPLVLQTKVPLDESNRTFERNASKAISRDAVENQRKIWMKRQQIKKLQEENKRQQQENLINANLRLEQEKLTRLKLESESPHNNMFYSSSAPHPSCGPMLDRREHDVWQQKPSYIHIENAQNIMIGNHSTMNIEHTKSSAEES